MPWDLRMIIRIFPFLLPAQLYLGWAVSRIIAKFYPGRAIIVWPGIIGMIIWVNLLPLSILYYDKINRLSQLFLLRNQTGSADYLILYPFWIGLIITVEVLPYFLTLDGISGLSSLVSGIRHEKIRYWKSILQMAILVFFTVFVFIRSYTDTTHIRLRQSTVSIPDLPPELKGLSLSLTADIQVDRYSGAGRLEKLESRIRQADSDLLFFAGDLVTRGQDFISRGLQFMCSADSTVPRFACMGDHDYWANPQKIRTGLSNCGWNFPENQNMLIRHNGKSILITGITYIYSKKISAGDLDRLFSSAPDADLKIVLVHQPARIVIEKAEKYGYDLLLAGHTHGGQIVFHPFGYSLTPSRFENEFYTGTHRFGKLTVVVTNGTGLTLAPLRYGAPAELTKIILSN